MRWFRWSAAGLLLAASALPMALAGCGPDGAGLDPRRAPLKVEPAQLRLPRIPFGKGAAGEFRLTNEGDEPLVITGIGPSGCDCAVADLQLPDRPAGQQQVRLEDRGMRLSLAPGEQAVLKLTLSTQRYREPVRFKASAIPVQFEDYDYLALEYSADIWVPFWTEPWALQYGTIGVRARPVGVVAVRALEEMDFEILAPDTVDGWELRVQRAHADGEPAAYRIEVLPPPELPVGNFLKEFELRTSIPDMPVRFTALGTAVPDVAHSPTLVMLRPDEGLRAAEVTVSMLAEHRQLALTAAAVRNSAGQEFPAEIVPVQAGRVYRGVGRLPDGAANFGDGASLRIATDDEETPLIEVDVLIQRTGPR